jgi:hypothetical protein
MAPSDFAAVAACLIDEVVGVVANNQNTCL